MRLPLVAPRPWLSVRDRTTAAGGATPGSCRLSPPRADIRQPSHPTPPTARRGRAPARASSSIAWSSPSPRPPASPWGWRCRRKWLPLPLAPVSATRPGDPPCPHSWCPQSIASTLSRTSRQHQEEPVRWSGQSCERSSRSRDPALGRCSSCEAATSRGKAWPCGRYNRTRPSVLTESLSPLKRIPGNQPLSSRLPRSHHTRWRRTCLPCS